MTPAQTPYLCGGILFSLILQARKTRNKARDKFNSGSDGLKDTDLMMSLVEVVTGDVFDVAGGTFGKCTTQFKTCQDYGTTYIPFTDPSVISSFNSALNKKDPNLLKRMSEYIEKYINVIRSEWLVKALIEVVQNDIEISDNTTFYISLNQSIAKADFCNIAEVELPIFLLSILGFILENRQDNTKGRPTFELWHEQKTPKSQWIYKANIGTSNTNTIIVHTDYEDIISEPVTSENAISSNAEASPKTATDRINEKILASGQALADAWSKAMEALADELDGKNNTSNNTSSSEEEIPSESDSTIIQQQTNIVQNGNNNVNLTNNGTINIKL